MRIAPWLLPVLTAIALASPASHAGEGEAGGKVAVVTEAPAVLVSTLRAELQPGTVGQVFRLLEQALSGKAQFVVSAGAKDVPLPGVMLRDTNALGLMNLIAHLVPDLRIRIGIGPDYRELEDVVQQIQGYEPSEYFGTAETRVVLVDLASQDRSGSAIERKLRIYRLADVQPIVDKGMTVDDLATAIETVWEVEPIPHVATLKFHRETNLLIVSGTAKHLALVDQVIEGISGRAPEASRAERMAELEASLARFEQRLGTLQVTMENHLKAYQQQATLLASLARQVQELERALAKVVSPGGGPK
jgi:hypothetical protein